MRGGVRAGAVAAFLGLPLGCGDAKSPNDATSTGNGGNSSSETGTQGGGTSASNAVSTGGNGSVAGAGGSAGTAHGGTEGSAVSGTASASETSGGSSGSSGSAGAATTSSCAPIVVPLRNAPLHVLLDVSASMGRGDVPYFSRELKWDPVTAALRSFTEDPLSEGTRATLTFFPNELAPLSVGGADSEGLECVAEDYATPDVPLTPLPSLAFGAAIDAVTPADEADWRIGGPMVAAFEGVLTAIDRLADEPGPHTVLFITDGIPADCPDVPESIEPLVEVVASVAAQVPTYVLGLLNPRGEAGPEPPDHIEDFNELAVAGGTDAFFVETESPALTTESVRLALDWMRALTTSCEASVADLPAGSLDEAGITLTYTSPATGAVTLDYDQGCSTDDAWRFDDENDPRFIRLCDGICQTVRGDAGSGQLSLDRGCP